MKTTGLATAVIGAGRLARSMLPLLGPAGYPVVAVAARRLASARAACRQLPGAGATTSLRTAVGACPTFADGHFNLASFLEQVARFDEAASHWQAYVRLDPHSEWADVARAHLERQARS